MAKSIAADQTYPDRTITMAPNDPILLIDGEGDPIRVTLRPDGVWQIARQDPKGRDLDPDGGSWHWVNVAEA